MDMPYPAAGEAAIPTSGNSLGVYQIGRLLGRTGRCSIFEGLDQSRNLPVLVRVFAVGTTDLERRAHEGFCRQARLRRRFTHPNTLRVLELIESPRYAALIVDRPTVSSLSEQLGQTGPMRRFRIAQLMGPVLEVLDAASTGGLLHGDLRPDCILLGIDRSVRLDDLGMSALTRFWFNAQASGSVALAESFPAGNPAYASPEVAAGGEPDVRADIYSLGAVLYHLAAGRPPFYGRTPQEVLNQHVRNPPTPPNQVTLSADPNLSDLIMRMLSKDPRVRPQSYFELIGQLGHIRQFPRDGHFEGGAGAYSAPQPAGYGGAPAPTAGAGPMASSMFPSPLTSAMFPSPAASSAGYVSSTFPMAGSTASPSTTGSFVSPQPPTAGGPRSGAGAFPVSNAPSSPPSPSKPPSSSGPLVGNPAPPPPSLSADFEELPATEYPPVQALPNQALPSQAPGSASPPTAASAPAAPAKKKRVIFFRGQRIEKDE